MVKENCQFTCGCDATDTDEDDDVDDDVNTAATENQQCVAKYINLFGLEFDVVYGDCYNPVEDGCFNRYEVAHDHPRHLSEPPWFVGCEQHVSQGDCRDSDHTAELKLGCALSCEYCVEDQVPEFKICVGTEGDDTVLHDENSIDGVEIKMTIYGRKCLKIYDPEQIYPSTYGNVDMNVEIRLKECNNPESDDCLRKLCFKKGNGGECDGSMYMELEQSSFEFGTTSHSQSEENTGEVIVQAGQRSYFEFSHWGELRQTDETSAEFGSAKITRRCYIEKGVRYDVDGNSEEYWEDPYCTLYQAHATIDDNTVSNPNFENINDEAALGASCKSVTSNCVNEFELPSGDSRYRNPLTEAWDDFESCEAEKQLCLEDHYSADIIKGGCACTCRRCQPDDYIDPEIGGAYMQNMDGTPGMTPGMYSNDARRRRLKRSTPFMGTKKLKKRKLKKRKKKRKGHRRKTMKKYIPHARIKDRRRR